MKNKISIFLRVVGCCLLISSIGEALDVLSGTSWSILRVLGALLIFIGIMIGTNKHN